MVHQKNVPIKRTPKTMTIYGNQAWKRSKKTPNMRTGGFLGMELKFLDNTLQQTLSTTISMADPSVKLCLNAVPLGSGESSRQGRRIWLDTLEIQGVVDLTLVNSAAKCGNTVTLWVVKDAQTNEAQMAAVDCIVPDAGFTTGNVASFPNLQWKERFQILATKRIDMNAGAGLTASVNGGDLRKQFQIKLPLKCHTTFDVDGDGGTVQTITDNSIHVIAVTTNTGSSIILNYQSRLRYVDT